LEDNTRRKNEGLVVIGGTSRLKSEEGNGVRSSAAPSRVFGSPPAADEFRVDTVSIGSEFVFFQHHRP